MEPAAGSDTAVIPFLPIIFRGSVGKLGAYLQTPPCVCGGIFRAGVGCADSPDRLCLRVVETDIYQRGRISMDGSGANERGKWQEREEHLEFVCVVFCFVLFLSCGVFGVWGGGK